MTVDPHSYRATAEALDALPDLVVELQTRRQPNPRQVLAAAADLRWIGRHYDDLAAHLAPTSSDGATNTFVPGPRIPCNTAALSHSHRYGVGGVLREWVNVVVEERKVAPPNPRLAARPYTLACVDMLHRNHEWTTDQEWFPDYARELNRLVRDMSIVLGLINEKPIPGDNKACVIPTYEGTPCGGKLFQDFDRNVIYCRNCREEWGPTEFMLLGRMLQDAELTQDRETIETPATA